LIHGGHESPIIQRHNMQKSDAGRVLGRHLREIWKHSRRLVGKVRGK
jgi:hypothetical protein